MMKKFNLQIIFILLSFLCLMNSCGNAKSDTDSEYEYASYLSKAIDKAIFIFLDAECPICQKYQGSLNKMGKLGLPCFYVFPGNQDTNLIHAFMDYDSIDFKSVIYDKMYELSHKLEVEVTPQAIILVSGKIEYSGLIDDRFSELGAFRPKANINYIEKAVNSLLKNETVQIPSTTAIGCYIESK